MFKTDKKLESKFLKTTEKRLKSVRDGKLRTGPEFLRIGVSRSCNFNCVSCWNYSPFLRKEKSKEWKELKIKKKIVFNTIDQFTKMNGIGILFSGAGEPFTHPEMMNFIKKSKENNLVVRLQTNLSLVDDISELANLLTSKADLVCVNLSAATNKTYIKIHPNQKKNSFDKIIDKIKVLTKKKVPVRFVYVVNNLNHTEIEIALKLNRKLGTRLHLENMDYDSNQNLSKFALDKKEKKNLLNILSRIKKEKKYYKKGSIENNLNDFIDQLNYSALGLPNLKSCFIGYFYSIIDELGNMFYCYNKDDKLCLGNLNSKSFKDIWFSKKYQQLRIRSSKGKLFKNCQICIKKRGSNFKVRDYINPELRSFKLGEAIAVKVKK